jgi:hypothetical protein
MTVELITAIFLPQYAKTLPDGVEVEHFAMQIAAGGSQTIMGGNHLYFLVGFPAVKISSNLGTYSQAVNSEQIHRHSGNIVLTNSSITAQTVEFVKVLPKK